MLEGKGLTKRYGGREVLSGVDIVLSPGQCLGLMGTNGSGKSTLIALLAQTVKADGGTLLSNGRSVAGDKGFLRKSIGYLPQQPALLGELKVKEQLRFWQRNRGLLRGLSGELEDLLGLGELKEQRIRDLSGGQQRRVSLALALMGEPDHLLMDEAFHGLDVNYQRGLAQWLQSACGRGKAVLWCSHDKRELLTLCPRCVALDNGKAVARGETAEVLRAMEGRLLW